MNKQIKRVRIEVSDEPGKWEVREACESVWILARNHLQGSIYMLLFRMFGNAQMHPKIDARTKKGREYNEAREALMAAAQRFDAAMRAYRQFD